jgi:hypothetical protein
MRKGNKKMKGGFLDSIGNTLSNWGSSVSQGATTAWNKTKEATSSAYNSATGSTTSSNTYIPTTSSTKTSTYTMGGKKKTRKHMKGGFKDNIAITGLASHAEPISDIKNAQPHNWVGGKTKKHHSRRKHRHYKSLKHHKKH